MPKRKDNLYETTYYFKGKQYHFYGKTAAIAKKKRDDFKELQETCPLSIEKYTLAEWVMAWVEAQKNTLSPQTYKSYSYLLQKHIGRAPIGQLLLMDLSSTTFRNYWAILIGAGFSARTVRYVHTITKKALNQAIEDGALRVNPLQNVTPPKGPRKAAEALTKDQIDVLLDSIDNEPFRRIVEFALATGMRRGEIIGLSWSNVNLDAGTITIDQSVIRKDGTDIISTNLKTKSSRRTITIDRKTIIMLKQQHAYCERLRLKAGGSFDKYQLRLVFPDEKGHIIHQNTLSKMARHAFDKINLPHFTFHSLRHTHATMLVKAGIHFKIIQHRLGHSSFNVTMDTYSHVIPEMDRQAVQIIEKIL